VENLYHLPSGPSVPEVVNVVIEVPRGSANKYEYDKELGIIKLDRVLFAAMQYPGDYGFIPSTLGGDGDPLDVVILSTHPFLPGVLVEVRVLGMLEMADDKGQDEKILAVPVDDPRWKEVQNLADVRQHILAEIEHFFLEYKTLERKKVTSEGWRDRAVALKTIEEAVARFKTK
jgi:inorganic pyrophosphatase